ncbi:MAG: transferrin receptor-like dimerization domain-containing protein [Thermoanaerobaculia bacterium]
MIQRKWLGLVIAAMLNLAAAPPPSPGGSTGSPPIPAPRGFFPASAGEQEKWEREFRSGIEPSRIRSNMETLSARPHHVGSEQGRRNAEWMLERFREWGWDAHLETFEVLFPTPKERKVELVEPVPFTAKLEEPEIPRDPTSGQKAEQLPTYNAYSIDGDVTAPLVYVNYGIPRDYDELARLGVSVEGKIVIARYGGSWRGIKPKVAAEHGAIGCLIYSDPRGDGYFEGDPYPEGAYRPRDGVQRGSVADMPLYPGDPETPGTGSTPGAPRLPLSEAKTLTKIPTLPLSAADAEPLMRHLGGPMAPEGWRGALPFSYHIGPGASKVHLLAKFNWELRPIRDVVAKLRGSAFPDQWILRGNHHDAWVNGADDPVSGLSAMLEEARRLGELSKRGWRPKRTIVYCAWDGEEPGLLGSTEWAETHAAELSQKAVAYINTDNSGRGFWQASASQTLQRFLDGVAGSIDDPETKISIASRLRAHDVWNADRKARDEGSPPEGEEKSDPAKVRARGDTPVQPLGSGSDYTVFLDHLGIASADLRFGGEGGSDGVYHSIYDDFYWYTHFSDTDFSYGRALAEAGGIAVMRLASADLLPFEYLDFSDAVSKYAAEIKRGLETVRHETLEHNREVEEGTFAAVEDPRHPTVLPKSEPVPPEIDFAPLERACLSLAKAARDFDDAFRHSTAKGAAAANDRIFHLERLLLSEDGLPGRAWFRNEIYAPGFYTGYGVKTLPAVREAIEQKNWKLAERQIPLVAGVLEREAKGIAEAAVLLK